MIRLQHGRVGLALHELSRKEGPALLLLHALYESSACWGDLPQRWPGAVFGLDFSGHGDSDRIRGGAYLAETLMGDADVALGHVGPAAIAGAGVGAYVALLLAGTRHDQVPAALLLPGAGLHGGGDRPDYGAPFAVPLAASRGDDHRGHDPFLRLLESDVRPADYAARFAAAARKLILADLGKDPPPWWTAAQRSAKAEIVDSRAAVAIDGLAAVL